jgi:hypothetical protein
VDAAVVIVACSIIISFAFLIVCCHVVIALLPVYCTPSNDNERRMKTCRSFYERSDSVFKILHHV